MTLFFILLWIGLGLIGSGFTNAYFKNEYPILDSPSIRRQDFIFSLAFCITGPINMIVAFLFSGYGKHGWTLSMGPPHTKSKW